MKFWSGNSEDISKYFKNTYVKFEGFTGALQEGEKSSAFNAGELVHYIDRVTGDFVSGKIRDVDGQDIPFTFELHDDMESAPNVEIILPKKSYFNAVQGACILYRIPARQWKKGIVNENTCIALLTATGFVSLPLGPDLITQYVRKPTFVGFGKHEGSYAVSRRMAVCQAGKLYIDTTRIGKVDVDKKEIVLSNTLFIPEVKRVLKEHGQDFNVTVQAAPEKKIKVKVNETFAISDEGELVLNEESV